MAVVQPNEIIESLNCAFCRVPFFSGGYDTSLRYTFCRSLTAMCEKCFSEKQNKKDPAFHPKCHPEECFYGNWFDRNVSFSEELKRAKQITLKSDAKEKPIGWTYGENFLSPKCQKCDWAFASTYKKPWLTEKMTLKSDAKEKPIGWTYGENFFLECQKCNRGFTSTYKKPYEVLCGHAICEQCFKKLPRNEVDRGYKYGIVCPLPDCLKEQPSRNGPIPRGKKQFYLTPWWHGPLMGIVKEHEKLVDTDGFQKIS
ncbi:unnamed protein product, partial [Mesorhabditis belari]|uniref:RING-type domain-containing protein n=1 Tax=Mesorhabditis belari TaxID=2138241 RepID=A0AAF3FQ23_9BILA